MLILLALEQRGIRRLELFVGALVLLVAVCFGFVLALSRPDVRDVLAGYVPQAAVLRDRGMLYVAVGILGATVMPHNLYLHSSLVQTRAVEATEVGKRSAIRHATMDTVLALGGAMLVNSAILVLAAAVFHRAGRVDVTDIRDAHRLLSPLLGSALASVAFAVALLAAGQSATITGTLSGQIVMSGFLRVRLKPWARRLLTRGLAIVPALLTAIVAGERGAADLLVGSQVILSLQLPFAIVPLLFFTADRRRMGALAAPRWMTVIGWVSAVVVIALNTYLVSSIVRGSN
ncbi:Manganese transport protein MntH [Minicystis rosea]|nr:Manganese transport protein MntH [Minicystis rosea]